MVNKLTSFPTMSNPQTRDSLSRSKNRAVSSASSQDASRDFDGVRGRHDDPGRKRVLAQYDIAVKLIHTGKFDKARQAFTKLLVQAPDDMAPSVRIYIRVCEAEIGKSCAKLSTTEERYDYAISLLNGGRYEDAREQLDMILKECGEADYAF